MKTPVIARNEAIQMQIRTTGLLRKLAMTGIVPRNDREKRHCEERSNPDASQDSWIASQARNDGESFRAMTGNRNDGESQ